MLARPEFARPRGERFLRALGFRLARLDAILPEPERLLELRGLPLAGLHLGLPPNRVLDPAVRGLPRVRELLHLRRQGLREVADVLPLRRERLLEGSKFLLAAHEGGDLGGDGCLSVANLLGTGFEEAALVRDRAPRPLELGPPRPQLRLRADLRLPCLREPLEDGRALLPQRRKLGAQFRELLRLLLRSRVLLLEHPLLLEEVPLPREEVLLPLPRLLLLLQAGLPALVLLLFEVGQHRLVLGGLVELRVGERVRELRDVDVGRLVIVRADFDDAVVAEGVAGDLAHGPGPVRRRVPDEMAGEDLAAVPEEEDAVGGVVAPVHGRVDHPVELAVAHVLQERREDPLAAGQVPLELAGGEVHGDRGENTWGPYYRNRARREDGGAPVRQGLSHRTSASAHTRECVRAMHG